MSEVFLPVPLEGSEWVIPVSEELINWSTGLGGRSREPSRWTVDILDVDGSGAPRKYAATPWFANSFLVLKGQAIEELGPRLSEFGELIPLVAENRPNENLLLFDCLTVCDVLDEEMTEFRIAPSGRRMGVATYGFKSEVVKDLVAFKPSEFPNGPLLLSSTLVEQLRKVQSSGTGFERVWAA